VGAKLVPFRLKLGSANVNAPERASAWRTVVNSQ
jgi:hypothetical protein